MFGTDYTGPGKEEYIPYRLGLVNGLVLSATEAAGSRTYKIPWFKKYDPELIAQYAEAFKKAAKNYRELLKGDKGNPKELGALYFFAHRG